MNIQEIRPYALTDSSGVNIETRLGECTAKLVLTNTGAEAAHIREVILLDGSYLTPDTAFYAEGYNMLSQYRGTVAEPKCLSPLTDKKHYRLPGGGENFFTAYNYGVFGSGRECFLVGFSSCNRFNGEIRFTKEGRLQMALVLENILVPAGGRVELEEAVILSGDSRNCLIRKFVELTARNHPALPVPRVPLGWSSWYCFGPNVTEKNITDNLDAIKKLDLPIRFFEIDDGYQAAMGDWFRTKAEFGDKTIEDTLKTVSEKGFDAAVWVAPFIAEEDSDLFRQHPDWFVMDETGAPLRSDRVTFGGWRCGPWYMFDPTVPEAYAHMKSVFATMRNQWNARFYMLDANMWGAMPFGIRHDPTKTSVEAYRLGMQAILEGVGEDSFILGCNAPMWPSMGTVHGMRITNDVFRRWNIYKQLKDECLSRNAYNGKLWVNDPDCVTLHNMVQDLVDGKGEHTVVSTQITQEEFLYHATYILASGGMIFCGDDLSSPDLKNLNVFRRLLEQNHLSAEFDDMLEIGTVQDGDTRNWFLLNSGEKSRTFCIPGEGFRCAEEIWTGERLHADPDGKIRITVPAHGGRVAALKQ